MSKIIKQDTNGIKPLLQVGELGYDNFPGGGDVGRVFVGTGTENIAQAKKSEVTAVDGKVDTHIGRVDNPHSVTKAQVGLSNVDNTSDLNKPISTATQTALNGKQDTLVSGTNIKTIEGQSLVGSGNIDLTKSDVGLSNVDNTADIDKSVANAANAEKLNGVSDSTTATASTIVKRDTNGDVAARTIVTSIAGTTSAASRYFVETGSDGYIRPKALADVKTEIGNSLNMSGTPTAPTAASTVSTTQVATTAFAVPRTSTTGSARLPVGTTAQRDASPVDGMIRYNSTTLGFEGYFNGQWQSVGGGQMFGNALVKAVSYNAQVIAENITVTAGLNAYSVGDIIINNGFTVTVENGSVYKIL